MTKTKRCPKCGLEKPLSEFYKRPERCGGMGTRPRCKVCEKKLVDVWRKNNWEQVKATKRQYNAQPYGAWLLLLNSAKKKQLDILCFMEFKFWYEKQIRVCSYCGITEASAKEVYPYPFNRRLTIDRMDNAKGYILSNMTLACSLCNHIKTNVFSADEMKEIAQSYVRKHFENTTKRFRETSNSLY